MTPERMRLYGKGLVLWQDKSLATAEHGKNPRYRVEPVEQAKGFWIEPTDECSKADNPLTNGVFLWTEIIGAGDVFVSVHQDNNPYVYTYGRLSAQIYIS